MASFLYGEPRLTQDIDIVADIQESHIPALLRSFPATEFYIDESSIRRAILAKSQFNIIHPSSGNKIDVIIVSKLEFYREGRSDKHLRDIAGIIKISGEELDLGYIASVTQGKGLREIWEELLEGTRK